MSFWVHLRESFGAGLALLRVARLLRFLIINRLKYHILVVLLLHLVEVKKRRRIELRHHYTLLNRTFDVLTFHRHRLGEYLSQAFGT